MLSISQSLIKDYTDLSRGSCGLQFKAKHIDKIPFVSTDVMKAGQWFEYVATGAKLRGGEIPETMLKTKPKRSKEAWTELIDQIAEGHIIINERLLEEAENDMPVMYYRLLSQAGNLRRTFEHYGVKIIETGKVITFDCGDFIRKGIVDVYAYIDGTPCFIDIKSSGMLNNTYEPMAWCSGSERLKSKEKIVIQAKDYVDIWKQSTGADIDFYFFVHSNSNEWESMIVKCEVLESTIAEHRQNVADIAEEIDDMMTFGFTPKPSQSNCKDCPIASGCEYYTEVPKIKTILL